MYYLRKSLARIAKAALGRPPYPGRYDQLYEHIRRAKPRTMLEIGTNDGLNAARMVAAAGGPPGDVRYFGLDLFEQQTGEAFLREFSLRTRALHEVAAYLERRGVRRPVLVAGDSTEILPRLVRDWPPMDVIFIDGGHSYETVLADWTNVQPLIGDRTAVFFDDYPNWGIGPVVDALDRSQWQVEILPVTDRFASNDAFGEGAVDGMRSFQLARVTRRSSRPA